MYKQTSIWRGGAPLHFLAWNRASAALAQNREIATTESAKRIPRDRFDDDGAESKLGRLIQDTNTKKKKKVGILVRDTNTRGRGGRAKKKESRKIGEVLFIRGGRSNLSVMVRPKESYYANGVDNWGDAWEDYDDYEQ
jgi:hypothetical protein